MTEARIEPLIIPARTWLVWAISVNILIAFTRILALSTSHLNLLPDEAQYWSWSRHMDWGYFSKPPLIAWIIAATTWLAGDAEWAVRLGAPLLHAATALAVFLLAAAHRGPRVGFLSSILYATLPGVTFSGLVISTDAPLLFWWAVALLATWRPGERPNLVSAVSLGVALGFGFLSKYAMGYFLLGIGVYLAVSPRAIVKSMAPKLGIAAAIAAIILAPNLFWNAAHGWATVNHTAANADWRHGALHWREIAEFVGAQFGVFGPVLFLGLILRLAQLRRRPADDPERFLMAFAVPVLMVMILQSGISRAHANWAAVSYVSATILVAGWFDRFASRWPLRLALLTDVGAFALFTLIFSGAIAVSLPKSLDIFHQMRGWQRLAEMSWRRMSSMPEEQLSQPKIGRSWPSSIIICAAVPFRSPWRSDPGRPGTITN